MRILITFVVAGAVALLVNVPSARAQASDLASDCKTELSKYCPDAKSQDEMMECIEKREKMGKKKSGLSHKCYEAHEKLETPEHEKTEKHEK
jgi:hypothetical protein